MNGGMNECMAPAFMFLRLPGLMSYRRDCGDVWTVPASSPQGRAGPAANSRGSGGRASETSRRPRNHWLVIELGCFRGLSSILVKVTLRSAVSRPGTVRPAGAFGDSGRFSAHLMRHRTSQPQSSLTSSLRSELLAAAKRRSHKHGFPRPSREVTRTKWPREDERLAWPAPAVRPAQRGPRRVHEAGGGSWVFESPTVRGGDTRHLCENIAVFQ